MHFIRRILNSFCAVMLSVGLGDTDCAHAAPPEPAVADLGAMLFFDPNLSHNRTQACATCHDPERAFTDGRENKVGGAASLGDDGASLGDRNVPMLAYAALSPSFHRHQSGHYVGGLFLDGRAVNLAEQALEPLTNPIEMALPDAASIIARLRENSAYTARFTKHFGVDIFADQERAMQALGTAIAAFERSAVFAPFDSKYDRYLRGEYALNPLEEMGRSLFFSPLTNCSSCHLRNISSLEAHEPFTNYRYHNIGLAANVILRKQNGLGTAYRDLGLADNPAIDDPRVAGKFKVPSLRNVAVTAPYMHNGIFTTLRGAILFYNKYTVHSQQSQTNPETGAPWGEPEVAETIDIDLLSEGQPIDEGRARALIAFLKTLTDARYEPLLKTDTAAAR